MGGKRIKIIKAAVGEKTGKAVGSIAQNSDKFSVVASDSVTVDLLEIQPEGSKPMTAKQFLNGNKIEIGTIIEDTNG